MNGTFAKAAAVLALSAGLATRAQDVSFIKKGGAPSDTLSGLHLDLAPNALQLEIIRRVAQQYRYIAFADMGHNRVDLAKFVLNRTVMGALADNGVENFYLERSPSRQPYLDGLASGGNGDSAACAAAIPSAHMCDPVQRAALCRVFEDGAKSVAGSMKFFAVDRRAVDGLPPSPDPAVNARATAYGRILRERYAAHGCLDDADLAAAAQTGGEEDFMELSLDDRSAAAQIHKRPGKGAIFYGGAHFFRPAGENGRRGMKNILSGGKENEIIVFEIYQDAAHKAMMDRLKEKEGRTVAPSIVLYITPSLKFPDGIEILNPDIAALIDEAAQNLHRRATVDSVLRVLYSTP